MKKINIFLGYRFLVYFFLFLFLFYLYFYFYQLHTHEYFQNSTNTNTSTDISKTNGEIYLQGSVQDLKEANNTVNKRTEICNSYFPDNSFCQWDEDINQCSCKYQKDSVKYPFPSPVPCCDRLCKNLPREKCMAQSKLIKPTYYCNIGGVCLERTATVKDNQISANNCGTDSLNNQLLLPYMSLEECNQQIDPCDIHNRKEFTETQRKDSCLNDVRCGYCTNKQGVGKCISGTPSGPLDLLKYYYCVPSRTDGTYEYQYGNHAEPLNITQLKK